MRKAKKPGIKIDCAFDDMVRLDRLTPHPDNPHIHPPKQVRKLADFIVEQGWRHPIIVSNRSGYIVAGHCRLLSARQLGLIEAPVDHQDFASDEKELAFLLGDNIIPEFAEMDRGKQTAALQKLQADDYPLELTAMDPDQLEALLADATDELKQLTYTERTLQPYKKTHVLLSFPPAIFAKIEKHLEKIIEIEGVEYEQGSN